MLCLACHGPAPTRLCPECRRGLHPGPERLLAGGVRLVAAFEHVGPAKTLVHHLKYRGIAVYADLVAARLGPRVPPLPLVPVPRALTRRMRYGVDPAQILAERISRRTGTPVVPALSPPLHSRRRAGRDHRRPVAGFGIAAPLPPAVVLVDDVVTTGATLESAIVSLGAERVVMAIAANAVGGSRR